MDELLRCGASSGLNSAILIESSGAAIRPLLIEQDGRPLHCAASADAAHCAYKNEYTDLLVKNIAAFLKHEGGAPGEIVMGSGGSRNMSDWVDRGAPALD